MTDIYTDADLQKQVGEEARESFDLDDFVRGRSYRTREVRVFLDEKTGELRGGVEQVTRKLANGMEIPDIRAWGKVGELAEAKRALETQETKDSEEARALENKITQITEEIRSLTKTLLESALDFELRSIPEVAIKGARRAAKSHLGIKGKGFDLDDDENYEEFLVQLLSKAVVSVTKHATGQKNIGMTIESARNLPDFLPKPEWVRLISQLNELLFEKAIATAAVEDPDFSHGI